MNASAPQPSPKGPEGSVSLLAWGALVALPVGLAAALLVGVVWRGNAHEGRPLWTLKRPRPSASVPSRCSWRCHDVRCEHKPRVVGPPIATYAKGRPTGGLYGWTIRALHSTGNYGLANLVVFCLLWPALTLSLWAWVVHQRLRLRALRRLIAAREGGS